ncbi:MAG: hypothetical protein GY708_20830 [Actinomycetia bacterium]|nr:hypothetical protein [Actinomycetes bacterium]MCP4959400.1 hypothetical protein [Actinomycetes bacterium]
MSTRDEHIDGLYLSHLTPVDIDVFFRTLARRVPGGVPDHLAPVLSSCRKRIKQLATDMGSADAATIDASLVERMCELLVEQFQGMKRRQWKARIGENRTIDYVRSAIGEISADLHELTQG